MALVPARALDLVLAAVPELCAVVLARTSVAVSEQAPDEGQEPELVSHLRAVSAQEFFSHPGFVAVMEQDLPSAVVPVLYARALVKSTQLFSVVVHNARELPHNVPLLSAKLPDEVCKFHQLR